MYWPNVSDDSKLRDIYLCERVLFVHRPYISDNRELFGGYNN